MSKLKVKVAFPDSVNPKQREILRKAIREAISYHGLENIEHTVYVTFKTFIQEPKKKGNVVQGGYMWINEHTSVVEVRLRLIGHMCATIFHEFTHLRHRLKREFITIPGVGHFYKGEPYFSTDEYEKMTYECYYNLPDEIDARYHENILNRRWAERGPCPKIIYRIINRILDFSW